MNTFFISDTHFGHTNIIKLANRPFTSVEEMDELMIANWNAKVGKKDTVYHLGDFSYRGGDPKTYFDRLNGMKILIHGNHDSKETKALPWHGSWNYRREEFGGKIIVMFHYPILEWDQYWRGSYHLYGHVHRTLKHPSPRALDLSVENTYMNYAPISLEDILWNFRTAETSFEKKNEVQT